MGILRYTHKIKVRTSGNRRSEIVYTKVSYPFLVYAHESITLRECVSVSIWFWIGYERMRNWQFAAIVATQRGNDPNRRWRRDLSPFALAQLLPALLLVSCQVSVFMWLAHRTLGGVWVARTVESKMSEKSTAPKSLLLAMIAPAHRGVTGTILWSSFQTCNLV